MITPDTLTDDERAIYDTWRSIGRVERDANRVPALPANLTPREREIAQAGYEAGRGKAISFPVQIKTIQPHLVTIDESQFTNYYTDAATVAARFGMSEEGVRKAARQRRIDAWEIGGVWIISVASAENRWGKSTK